MIPLQFHLVGRRGTYLLRAENRCWDSMRDTYRIHLACSYSSVGFHLWPLLKTDDQARATLALTCCGCFWLVVMSVTRQEHLMHHPIEGNSLSCTEFPHSWPVLFTMMEELLGRSRGWSLQCPRRLGLGTSRVHWQLNFDFEDHSFRAKPLHSSLVTVSHPSCERDKYCYSYFIWKGTWTQRSSTKGLLLP